jgi:hypothetical protein
MPDVCLMEGIAVTVTEQISSNFAKFANAFDSNENKGSSVPETPTHPFIHPPTHNILLCSQMMIFNLYFFVDASFKPVSNLFFSLSHSICTTLSIFNISLRAPEACHFFPF